MTSKNATDQPNPERLAKNIRILLIFLGVLNVVMLTVIAVLVLGGSPQFGLGIAVLLGLWDWNGFRIVRRLRRGDTSFK